MTPIEELKNILLLDIFTAPERTALRDPKIQKHILDALEHRQSAPEGAVQVSSIVLSHIPSLNPSLASALRKFDARCQPRINENIRSQTESRKTPLSA
jgi:hypothetical protein